MNLSATHIFALAENISDERRLAIFKQYNIRDLDHLLRFIKEKGHDMDFQEYKLRHDLLRYVSPFWIFIGTIGNILSFFVLRQPAMVKMSTYFYLSILSMVDLMVLYVGLVQIWIGEITSFDIRNYSNWVCKIVVVFGYFTSNLSVWLIIAVTVERYIVVCFPFKATYICHPKVAKRVTMVLVFILLALNFHFFWTAELIHIPLTGKMSCDSSNRHSDIVREVWPWVDATVYCFLPFLAILSLNCRIIGKVMKARKSRESLQNRSSLKKLNYKKLTRDSRSKLTVMLLIVSFVFLGTTLPMNIVLILRHFLDIRGVLKGKVLAQLRLAETVTKLLMYANHSTNFFLYCAMGQRFRKQLVKLLCPWNNTKKKFLISKQSKCNVRNFVNFIRQQKTKETSNDLVFNPVCHGSFI